MAQKSMDVRKTSTEETVKFLNTLIEICRNAYDGYMQAAEGINSAAYKTMFAEYALERSRFASQLVNVINDLGGEPDDDGVVNAWTNIGPAVMGGDNGTIFDVCEYGEDVASKEYVRVMESDLPEKVQNVVSRQYERILDAHKRIRNLRDAYRAQNKN